MSRFARGTKTLHAIREANTWLEMGLSMLTNAQWDSGEPGCQWGILAGRSPHFSENGDRVRTGSGPFHRENLKTVGETWGLRRSTGVRLEQSAEAGGTNDFTWGDRVVRLRRFVPGGRKVVASGVRAICVVPVLQIAIDEVEVVFGDDQQPIESLDLNRLNHSFDMCPEVRGSPTGPTAELLTHTSRCHSLWIMTNTAGSTELHIQETLTTGARTTSFRW